MKVSLEERRLRARWSRIPPNSLVIGSVVRRDDEDDVLAYVAMVKGRPDVRFELCWPTVPSARDRIERWAESQECSTVCTDDLCTLWCEHKGDRVPRPVLNDLMIELEGRMRKLAQPCKSDGVKSVPPVSGGESLSKGRNAESAPAASRSRGRPGISMESEAGAPVELSPDQFQAVMKVVKAKAIKAARIHKLDRNEIMSCVVEDFWKTYGRNPTRVRTRPEALVESITRGVVARLNERRTRDRVRAGIMPERTTGMGHGRRHLTREAMMAHARADVPRRLTKMLGRAPSGAEEGTLEHIRILFLTNRESNRAAELLKNVLCAMHEMWKFGSSEEIFRGGMVSQSIVELLNCTVEPWAGWLRGFRLLGAIPKDSGIPNLTFHQLLPKAIDALNPVDTSSGKLFFLVHILENYDVFSIGRHLTSLEMAAVAMHVGIEPVPRVSKTGKQKLVTGGPFDALRKPIEKAREKYPRPHPYLPKSALPQILFLPPEMREAFRF